MVLSGGVMISKKLTHKRKSLASWDIQSSWQKYLNSRPLVYFNILTFVSQMEKKKVNWMFLCVVNDVVCHPFRHVQEACVSSLHDEGKLPVRKQLCLLSPWGKWTATAPQPPCQQPTQPTQPAPIAWTLGHTAANLYLWASWTAILSDQTSAGCYNEQESVLHSEVYVWSLCRWQTTSEQTRERRVNLRDLKAMRWSLNGLPVFIVIIFNSETETSHHTWPLCPSCCS